MSAGGKGFAGIDVRAQIVARNAGGSLGCKDVFGPDFPAIAETEMDCWLRLAKKLCGSGLTAERLDAAPEYRMGRFVFHRGTYIVYSMPDNRKNA